MSITFTCDECDTELTVKDEMAGKSGKCPSCQAVVSIPRASTGRSSASTSIKKGRRDVDDEDDRPARKRSRRDDDDDEEDRPARKRSRSDDDDEDDRPARGRSRRDDEEEGEIDDQKTKRKRKARFRFAALGVRLYSIGGFLYAGAFAFAALVVIILTASIASEINKYKRNAGKWVEESKADEERAKTREEMAVKLRKAFLTANPNQGFGKIESDNKILLGIHGWAGGYNSALTAIGLFAGLFLIAGMILTVLGLAFMLRTPCGGATLGLSIANLAAGAIAAICLIVGLITLIAGDGGTWALLPFAFLNPLHSMTEATYMIGLATWVVSAVGAVLIMLPLFEITRLVTFSIFQMIVGKKCRDRQARFGGFLMVILIPSVIFGVALMALIMASTMPTKNAYLVVTLDDTPTPWSAGITLALEAILLGALLVWNAASTLSLRRALYYAK